MTRDEHDQAALLRCCCGNQEAIGFLLLWREYVHAIDDIIDGDRTGPEHILATFALAATLYSHPYYLRNIAALRALVYSITNSYADSVAWEKEGGWRKEWADHNRHAGAEMVLAVAQLCGGYGHMRTLSPELRTICYCEHHDREGRPV